MRTIIVPVDDGQWSEARWWATLFVKGHRFYVHTVEDRGTEHLYGVTEQATLLRVTVIYQPMDLSAAVDEALKRLYVLFERGDLAERLKRLTWYLTQTGNFHYGNARELEEI